MLQKKKKKKRRKAQTKEQPDRQGSKRFQLSQFCCVLSEIKNGEGDNFFLKNVFCRSLAPEQSATKEGCNKRGEDSERDAKHNTLKSPRAHARRGQTFHNRKEGKEAGRGPGPGHTRRPDPCRVPMVNRHGLKVQFSPPSKK